jgi:hypothetical protein
MSGALTVTEALGPTLSDLVLAAIEQSRRPARMATCPVCGGTMRRLADAAGGYAPAANELVCGECASVLVDDPLAPPAGQLRLVG